MVLSLLLFLALYAFVAIDGGRFPDEIEKCSYGDSNCIIDKLNDVFRSKHKGYQPLLLPSLDPLRINKMSLVQGAESRVNIALRFTDIDMIGLSKSSVYRASGFTRVSELDTVDIRFKTPTLMVKGPYRASGRILLLPFTGQGLCSMILDDVHFLMKFKARTVEQNGKPHLQLEKSKMTFNTTRLHMNFTDLFNGNSELGKNMNRFINENWRDILDDLKGTIVDSFGEVFSTIINHVFSNFPYTEMFN